MVDTEFLENERVKIWERLTAIEKSVKDNKETIHKGLPEYISEAKEDSRQTSMYRNRTKDSSELASIALSEIEDVSNEIKRFNNSAKSLYSEIQKKIADVNSLHSDINTKNVSITNLVNSLNSIATKYPNISAQVNDLNNYISEGTTAHDRIKLLLESSKKNKDEIQKLLDLISGYPIVNKETGEEDYEPGLKDELEVIYEDIKKKVNDYKKIIEDLVATTEGDSEAQIENWNKKYKILEKEIQALLPNAMSAGLSHAYYEKKNEEKVEIKKHFITFNWSIVGLVAVSLIPFVVSVVQFCQGVTLTDLLLNLPKMASAILPLYLPILWIAYSSDKKVNLSKRLIEEYTHKEVLSKTFEGLSKQAEEMNESDVSSELKTKLLYNLIFTSSENPGKLISDYKTADHPMMDALEKSAKYAKALDRLSNIPGFASMATNMASKIKKINIEASAKVDAVIDSDTEDGES